MGDAMRHCWAHKLEKRGTTWTIWKTRAIHMAVKHKSCFTSWNQRAYNAVESRADVSCRHEFRRTRTTNMPTTPVPGRNHLP
jgi:hypothetical protein